MVEQKRVTFEVAKAIKEAGYPQNIKECPFYNEEGTLLGGDYDFWKFSKKFSLFYIVPTYLSVWLWLWREKHIAIEADYSFANNDRKDFNDPEETIIAAIEYLVENKLLK